MPDQSAGPGTEPARRRLTGARVAPVTTVLAGLICAALGAGATGGRGAVSALLATAVVVCFFWSGLVPLFLAREASAAGLALVVLLVNYVLRLVLVLGLLGLASQAGVVDDGVLGLSVIACALTWTGTQAALLSR